MNLSLNSGPILITFKTDASRVSRGFAANYRVTRCNGTYTLTEHAESVVIQSPTFPAHYTPEMNCVWSIETDPGYIISLK